LPNIVRGSPLRSRSCSGRHPRVSAALWLCLLAGTLAGVVRAAPAVAGGFDPAALCGEFRQYRRALADPYANPVPYFSRRTIEMWSGELLTERDRLQLLDELDIARNRYRFAERVYIVFAFEASAACADTAVLKILYRTRSRPGVQVLRLTYVYEAQRWRIEQITFALTRAEDARRAVTARDTFE